MHLGCALRKRWTKPLGRSKQGLTPRLSACSKASHTKPLLQTSTSEVPSKSSSAKRSLKSSSLNTKPHPSQNGALNFEHEVDSNGCSDWTGTIQVFMGLLRARL